jgi:hypothetical protein
MRRVDFHAEHLDKLVRNLTIIDEDPTEIEWIIKEGIWFRPNSIQYRTLCDGLIGYSDGTGSVFELKGDRGKRQHALKQIHSGFQMLEEVYGRTSRYGKLVIYYQGNFKYETISR